MTAFNASKTRTGYGAIDIVVNVFTPEAFAEGRIPTDDTFRDKVGNREKRGVSIEDYLRKMDAAGIERSLLIAVRCGDLRVKGSVEIPYEWVRDICAKYPDRFSGLAGIDPTSVLDSGITAQQRAQFRLARGVAHGGVYAPAFGQQLADQESGDIAAAAGHQDRLGHVKIRS